MNEIEKVLQNKIIGRVVGTGEVVHVVLSDDYALLVTYIYRDPDRGWPRGFGFWEDWHARLPWEHIKEVSTHRKKSWLGDKGLIEFIIDNPKVDPKQRTFQFEVKNIEIAKQVKAIMDQKNNRSKIKAEANRVLAEEKLTQAKEEERKRLELERLKKIKHASGDFNDVTPLQFERIIEELFITMGYSVTHVGRSGDEGIDLVCNNLHTKELAVVQCKRYKKEIGAHIVRDFYGAFVHSGATAGYIITTSHFTKQAIQWIGDKPIKLINKIQLQNLLIEYYNLQ